MSPLLISDCAVAPFAGAWIEMVYASAVRCQTYVAPFAGAWIEMITTIIRIASLTVAPFAGAWIEMLLLWNVGDIQQGRFLRGSVD